MANCMHTDTGMTGKSFHQVKTVSCITLLPFQTQLLHKLVFFFVLLLFYAINPNTFAVLMVLRLQPFTLCISEYCAYAWTHH